MPVRSHFLAVFLIVFLTLGTSVWAAIKTSPQCKEITLSTSTKFSGCHFRRTKLDGLNRPFIDLSKAELSDASFKEANLSHANLKSARMINTDFTDANLYGANILGHTLIRVIINNAILDYALVGNGKICAENSIGECNPIPASGNDAQDVIQTMLYHPDLRNLTNWTKKNLLHPMPYPLATNKFITEDMSFRYFSMPVKLNSLEELRKNNKEGNYLYIYRMSVNDKFANISYKYPEYGLEGDMSFNKHAGFWMIISNTTRYSKSYRTPQQKLTYIESQKNQEQNARNADATYILAGKGNSIIMTPKKASEITQAVLDHKKLNQLTLNKNDALIMLENEWLTSNSQLVYQGKPVQFMTEGEALRRRFTYFFEITKLEFISNYVKVHYALPEEARFGTFHVKPLADGWLASRHQEFESSSGRRERLARFYQAEANDIQNLIAKIEQENVPLITSCKDSVASACYELGILHYKNKIYNSAKDYYQKSCNLKHDQGCHNYASLVLMSRYKTPDDYISAQEILENLCQKGIKRSCRNLDRMKHPDLR